LPFAGVLGVRFGDCDSDDDDDDDDDQGGGQGQGASRRDFDILEDDGTEVLAVEKADRFGLFESGVTFDRLARGELIGEGTFGKVFEGTYFGSAVAVKDVSKAAGGYGLDREALTELAKECKWRYALQHAFVADLLAVNVDHSLGAVCLVTTRHPCSLWDLLHDPDLGAPRSVVHGHAHAQPDPELLRSLPLTMRQRLVWLRQVCLGMDAVHKAQGLNGNSKKRAPVKRGGGSTPPQSTGGGLTHWGLTSSNVVIASHEESHHHPHQSFSDRADTGGKAKAGGALNRTLKAQRFAGHRGCVAQVTDFGLQRVKRASLEQPSRKHPKTGLKHHVEESALPYMAPEVVEQGAERGGCAASDVFSFYALMFEVITGKVPHDNKEPGEVVKFSLAKKRLPLPTDAELATRWHELQQHHFEHKELPRAIPALCNERVAHKPLPPPNGKAFKDKATGESVPGVRELYEKCAAQDPKKRPSFEALARDLGKLINLVGHSEPVLPPLRLEASERRNSVEAEGFLGSLVPKLPRVLHSNSFQSVQSSLTSSGSSSSGSSDSSSSDSSSSESGSSSGPSSSSAPSTFSKRLSESMEDAGRTVVAAAGGVSREVSGDSSASADSGVHTESMAALTETLCSCPVMLVNADSRRKLFAQSLAKPKGLGIGGWSQGFGAGPEVHTFDDNMWWLIPHNEVHHEGGPVDLTFVVENAHSKRRLYAQPFKQRERTHRLERGVGAIMPQPDDFGALARAHPENRWRLVQHEATGTFQLKNRSSDRLLFARQPRPGEPWHVGVGAIPNPHVPLSQQPPNTFWYLVPQPAALVGATPQPPRGNISSISSSFEGVRSSLEVGSSFESGTSGSSPSSGGSHARPAAAPPPRKGYSTSGGGGGPPRTGNRKETTSTAAAAADAAARANRETKARKAAEEATAAALQDKEEADAAVAAMEAKVERLEEDGGATEKQTQRASAELEAAQAVGEAANAAKERAEAAEEQARAAEYAKLSEGETASEGGAPEKKVPNPRRKTAPSGAKSGSPSPLGMPPLPAHAAEEKPPPPPSALASPGERQPTRKKSFVKFAEDPTSNAPPSAATTKPAPSRKRPQPSKGRKAPSSV